MKKLFGMAVAIMLGINLVGCDSTIEETATVEDQELIQEEIVEVEEQETIEEEVIEEPEEEVEVEEFNEEEIFDTNELNYYMTTNLTEDEYDEYFNSIAWTEDGDLREVEFDGQILMANLRDGYDTRFEMLMATGDYADGNFSGPYIKVKDIAGTDLGNLVFGKCNVKVKGKIHGYDKQKGWLEISIDEITER